MLVMKFGGSSMGNAERIARVAQLVQRAAVTQRLGVVVSAVGGVTNQLVNLLQTALKAEDVTPGVQALLQQHHAILSAITPALPDTAIKKLMAYWEDDARRLSDELRGVQLLGICPDATQAKILARGELWSSTLFFHVLDTQQQNVQLIAATDVIKTNGSLIESCADFTRIDQAFAPYRDSTTTILLMPGFIGEDSSGQLSLLGRNGSDLSGALMAMGLHAEACEIWTDVDGVYSADPRLVPEAKLIPELSYAEAMELSYFGAKVLHPKTITPIARFAIPTRIKNTFAPDAPGSLIHAQVSDREHPVRGISCLNHMALINFSGPGMKGVAGMSARVLDCLAQRQISVNLVTQSSSEYSLSLCVAEKDAATALLAIADEFQLERAAGWLETQDARYDQTIISIVGDSMRDRRGIAGAFFSALAQADVNIAAIAQGSSERSISAVIDGKDAQRALLATHQHFFHSAQIINLFLAGRGNVATALLQQISQQRDTLLQQGVDLRVHGQISTASMCLSEKPLTIANGTIVYADQQKPDWSVLFDFIHQHRFVNPVLVDCSASQEVAERYLQAFNVGMHVVTPNKRANTLSQSYYRELRQTANRQQRRFLYETNVGAALPVIDTLQNLLKSGDKLIQFSGILSGTLSFIFGLLEEGHLFSDAVRIAHEKKFTEPDPRDDLSGMDVARKLLILFREAGGNAELDEVEIVPLFPSIFNSHGSVNEFMHNIRQLDHYFNDWQKRIKPEQKVLRFAAEISNGKCRVGIIEVDNQHPLYAIKGGENALSFTTARYQPVPLVIRGYGAGADVTAGGVFADVLRTVSFNPHYNENH